MVIRLDYPIDNEEQIINFFKGVGYHRQSLSFPKMGETSRCIQICTKVKIWRILRETDTFDIAVQFESLDQLKVLLVAASLSE